MDKELDSGMSSAGSSLGQGHCVVFLHLGKTIYSHSASLHPAIQMYTCKFSAGGNPVMD